MKHKTRNPLFLACGFLTAFALWTAAVRFVDVQPIGPLGSCVGFASVNRFFHGLTGVHMVLYILTDWLSLIPVGLGFGFALLGLFQWIKRKSLLKVDRSILVLGGFYLAVLTAYVLFECFPVNYRPILINGVLEVSYPSSTTLLVLTVMTTALMQFKERIKNKILNRTVTVLIISFAIFMVVGRLISGVHWLSDIIGGILLSTGLVMGYRYTSSIRISI